MNGRDLPPPSRRLFACGASGSGKTQWIWERIVPAFPRVIAVDQIGDAAELARPDAVSVFSVDEVLDALHELAAKPRWQLVAALGYDEILALSRILVPVPDVRRSFVRAIGGAALVLDEVDLIAPASQAPEEIRNVFRRSRHAGLTVIGATQRIGNVSREVTSQVGTIAIFAQHEPGDVRYIREVVGAHRMPVIWQLSELPHSVYVFDTRKRVGTLFDKDGQVIAARGVTEQLSLETGEV